MTTVNVDIEAVDGMHSWQQHLFEQIIAGGITAGKMNVISAGRQTGKSYYQQYVNQHMASIFAPPYKELDNAVVDGERWLTVQCNNESAAWVREQNQKYVYEHNNGPRNVFDIHDKLYTMLKIKFTP